MEEQYFVVSGFRKSGDDVRAVGQFIVNGEVVASGGSAKAKIKIPKPLQVKWIFLEGHPPEREWAEAMGYETIPLDDWTYPG